MSVAVDPSMIPGGLEVSDRREHPLGSIEFEYAPVGYLTKDGKVRQKDWRAYYWTPTDGKRARMPSVSTVLDCILPKPGLPPWSEARGIEGAVEAARLGALDGIEAADAVGVVRSMKLGADRARDDAAERGVNVHDLLREFMQTGTAPTFADHPEAHHGYIRALSRWLLTTDLEPEVIEEMVCSPEDGYAGRTDLVAKGDGFRIRFDAKTQERGAIYESAHVQVKLYDRAAVAMGDPPADLLKVVVFAENGEFREMTCMCDDATADHALAWWRSLKGISSACESANRIEREARR